MKADLSLVFDKYGEVRCNLMEQVPIQEIDKYTTSKEDSNGVREDFKEQIESYKLKNYSLLNLLPDKRGRIVIIYSTENKDFKRRLRVLYKKHANKLDLEFVLKKITSLLKNNPIDLTIDTIEEHPYIFDSSFAKDRLRYTKKRTINTKEDHRVLVDQVIGDTITNIVSVSFDKAYFYVRKIDSYLERKRGYTTTPVMVPKAKKQDEPKTSKPEKETPPSKIKKLDIKKVPDSQYKLNIREHITIEQFVDKILEQNTKILTEDEFIEALVDNGIKENRMDEIYEAYKEYQKRYRQELRKGRHD